MSDFCFGLLLIYLGMVPLNVIIFSFDEKSLDDFDTIIILSLMWPGVYILSVPFLLIVGSLYKLAELCIKEN